MFVAAIVLSTICAKASSPTYVEVTMNDGTVKIGYYYPLINLTKFDFSTECKGKKETIKVNDVKQVVYLPTEDDTTRQVFVSRRLPSNIAETKPGDDNALFCLFYHDDNVEIFCDLISAPPLVSNGANGLIYRDMTLYRWLFIRTNDDSDFVHTLYVENGGKLFMRTVFKRNFPETYAKIKSKEINIRKVKKDPTILIPYVSAEIARAKQQK